MYILYKKCASIVGFLKYLLLIFKRIFLFWINLKYFFIWCIPFENRKVRLSTHKYTFKNIAALGLYFLLDKIWTIECNNFYFLIITFFNTNYFAKNLEKNMSFHHISILNSVIVSFNWSDVFLHLNLVPTKLKTSPYHPQYITDENILQCFNDTFMDQSWFTWKNIFF